MSHIARIKSRMVETEYVIKALDDLGYKHATRGDVISVKTSMLRPSIGLRKTGGSYTVSADTDLVRRSRLQRFTDEVTQRYTYHAIRDRLEQQGFELATEETAGDGKIHLVLRRAG